MFTFKTFRSQDDRATTRRPTSRRPIVEGLEGRNLLSSVSVSGVGAMIQGAHIGTGAMIQGAHIGTGAMIQGAHIGTGAMIQGNHIG